MVPSVLYLINTLAEWSFTGLWFIWSGYLLLPVQATVDGATVYYSQSRIGRTSNGQSSH